MDRAHATDIGQRAGFRHGGGLDDDRRRGVGHRRGGHGEEGEWNENGFHGGAFQTVGGSEPGSLGKDHLVSVIFRPIQFLTIP